MRIVGEIPHPFLKITIFKMDTRFSVKFETGMLEQIYKFRDGEGIEHVEDAIAFVDAQLIRMVEEIFENMQKSKLDSLRRAFPPADGGVFEEII